MDMKREPIYLDYAATTPLSKRVWKKMKKVKNAFGNPSSLHYYGQESFSLLEEARFEIADRAGVAHRNVFFGGSATEMHNLYITSIVSLYKKIHNKIPHILISPLEHDSVYKTVKALSERGEVTHTLLSSSGGVVESEGIEKEIKENTALVSVIGVQNEIGTIQPLEEIYKKIKKKKDREGFPFFYTDAVQMVGLLPFSSIQADAYGFSAHKIYGPKGVGVLVLKSETTLTPQSNGGGQERGMRSGTENVMGIVGCSEALIEAEEKKEAEHKRIKKLQTYMIKRLKEEGISVWAEDQKRSPHIVSITSPSLPTHSAHIFDSKGFAVSAGSACSQRSSKISRILKMCGASKAEAERTIRISIGRNTKKSHIDQFIKTLIIVLQ